MKSWFLIVLFVLTMSPILAFGDMASVTINGISETFDYSGTGVTITNVDSDLDAMSLILAVNATGNPGTLEITFDRSFFDSQIGGTDEPFIVLADGDEPTFEETSTLSSRTLKIEVPNGTEEIEIIGTSISTEPTIPTPEPTTPTPEPTTPTPEPTTPTPTTKPSESTDTIECGEGTVLKDGLCVLDETCGEGTILKDGVCVLAPVEKETSSKGLGYEGMIGVIAGFIVAGVVAGILAIISKGSRSKN